MSFDASITDTPLALVQADLLFLGDFTVVVRLFK
jgi:hypothetical protein